MISGDDILVRLIGDGSSYQRMIQGAFTQTARLHGLMARPMTGVPLDNLLQSVRRIPLAFGQMIGPVALGQRTLFDRVGEAIAGFGGRLQGLGSHYQGVGMEAIRFNSTLSAIAVTAGTIGFARFIQSSLSAAAMIEDVRIQLDVLTGSAELGEQAMSDLWQLAIETPLGLRNVTQGAGVLFQHDAAGTRVAETMRMLGDVAGISSERLGRMVLAYSQVQAEGKLAGQELRQMINAGFNPLAEMARTTGKSMAQLRKEMFDGAISADMVRQAFESATGPGGRFHNMLERRAGTIFGMYEIMTDRLFQAKGELGAFLVEVFNLKGVMTGLAFVLGGVVDWFKQLSPETKSMIGSFVTSIAVFGSVRLVVSGLALAIGGLWSVIAASPLGIIPTLVIAAVGAFALLRTEADRFMELQGNMPDTISTAQQELARVRERLARTDNQTAASSSGIAGFSRGALTNITRILGGMRFLGTNDIIGTGLADARQLLEAEQRQLESHIRDLQQADWRRQVQESQREWDRLRPDADREKSSRKVLGVLKKELDVRKEITNEVRTLSFLLKGTSEANLWLYDYARNLAIRADESVTVGSDGMKRFTPGTGVIAKEQPLTPAQFTSNTIAPIINPLVRILNRLFPRPAIPEVPQIVVPVPQQSP